ncbi:zinc finger, CCHC-type containing protein, partial [Tanacetum coccineum]
MQDPKDHHLKAVKQVIRYIKGTKEHGIIYKKEGGCKITGYSDSSYGINTDQGKGTTGIVFYFGESPITWCTQKQPTVALSSCESEFMAATGAACQALWLKRLLSELTGWAEKRITLKVDNVSAIALVRNPVFHGRSKHIDIRYHFIRECVENGHINVEHVSGELQRADILTKALPRLKRIEKNTPGFVVVLGVTATRKRKNDTLRLLEKRVSRKLCRDPDIKGKVGLEDARVHRGRRCCRIENVYVEQIEGVLEGNWCGNVSGRHKEDNSEKREQADLKTEVVFVGNNTDLGSKKEPSWNRRKAFVGRTRSRKKRYRAASVLSDKTKEVKIINSYMMAGDDMASTSAPKPVTPIAQYQCPKLKSTNYTVWAIQIKVILEAHGLWEAIESKEVDIKKDKATIAFLYQALTEDMILQVAGCETAKELWDSLKTRHVGEERVQQARLQSLMIGFNALQMKDDDTVDAFTAKLNGYATKAKELGKTLDESLLVRKLLDSTPDRFIQIVASIEQTSDLDDITLDEITGKLKAFEERIKLRKGGQVESQDNLLFAQGEHSGKGRRFKRGSRSNFSRGNWQNNRNRNNSQGGNSNHKGNSTRNKGEWDLSKIRCHKCKKFGHLRRDCRGTSTTQEQSNLILEDDEPSLLMTTHEEILLNEGQIQPGKYASGDASMWYLDNGASNHMTGVKSHFKDINESVSGRVRFGDGSYVQIKGRGSVLLGYKNQEQKIVSDVYYIPNLKSNILSLGQLTEIGCKVIMDGNKLTLYDKNKRLLMKVERSKNRLYKIRLQVEAPICLLANIDNQAWLWHARLGHLNFDDINKMTKKNLVEGVPRINHAGQICDACLLGKQSRTPFPNQAKFRSKNPLDLVYGDLCGPISPATHSGKKLIFLLVDD